MSSESEEEASAKSRHAIEKQLTGLRGSRGPLEKQSRAHNQYDIRKARCTAGTATVTAHETASQGPQSIIEPRCAIYEWLVRRNLRVAW